VIRNALTVALCAALGLSGALGWLWWAAKARNDALVAQNADLQRSVMVLRAAEAQAAEAHAVAKAAAARWERRAAEIQQTLNTLTEGIEDAPLDPDLADRINQLRTRDPD